MQIAWNEASKRIKVKILNAQMRIELMTNLDFNKERSLLKIFVIFNIYIIPWTPS